MRGARTSNELLNADDNAYAPAFQVLLILQVLVGRDEGLETRRLRSGQQFTILERGPSLSLDRSNFVARKLEPEFPRNGFVKKQQQE